jgi:hypothetical protein
MASTTREFNSPYRGAIAFDLDAPAAEVVVTVSPTAEMAHAELTGPDEIVNDTRPTLDDGRWGLILPTPAATGGGVIRVGNNITISSVGPGMVITGDSMTFVNGRLVGGTNIRTAQMPETPRLFVTLPAGSRIDARMTAGKLTVRGYLPAARINSTSADIDIETIGKLRARTASGDITAAMVGGASVLRTMSGDITVDEATADVTAESMSGDIAIGTGVNIAIEAESMSGDITVRPYDGARPDVRAHSMSGRVRTNAR